MTITNEQAWGEFWAGERQRGGGGCLPDGGHGIEPVMRSAWEAFATSDLEPGTRVLDLATGDGRVMRWLKESRPDLDIVGVDLAPTLPDPPSGTSVRPGIAMESLPFVDGSFEAVVSQFGFEYGDIGKIAVEVARVLVPGGQLALVTHRIDGPILSSNRQRRMEIGWIFERKNLFRVAGRFLQSAAAGIRAVPHEIEQVVREAAHRFGPRSVAWEIAEAVRRTLGSPSAQAGPTLDMIERQARNELGRIDSLAAACQVTADADAFAAALSAGGFEEVDLRPLVDESSQKPFADYRRYRLTN